MQKEEELESHLAHLDEIRQIMSRSTRFLSLSGLSGISAGLTALAGGALAYVYLYHHHYNVGLEIDPAQISRIHWPFLIILAGGVFLVAFALAFYFSSKLASRKLATAWGPALRRLLIALAQPLAVGALFCTLLYSQGHVALLAPSTLIFYGLALLNAGKYTLNEIQALGLLQCALGLLGIALPAYGFLLWLVGFGLLHIGYGVWMYYRYEQ